VHYVFEFGDIAMNEFTKVFTGIRFGQIITMSMIYQLILNSEAVNIFRSGVYFTFGDLADVILRACSESSSRKEIRIVYPSIFNPDVVNRSSEVGRCPDEVLVKLGDWQETASRLGLRLHPHHYLEVRTTTRPHRYHTIFSENGGILGPAWIFKASLTTSSLTFGKEETALLANCHEDFNRLWDQSTPYAPGDNERNRKKNAVHTINDENLIRFHGKTLHWVVEALKYVASAFPGTDGNGATNRHLSIRFGTDESTCNKRLLEMEHAGLVCRVPAGRHRHGRVVTEPGQKIAEKYKYFRTDFSR
jgi:hypothetical protein